MPLTAPELLAQLDRAGLRLNPAQQSAVTSLRGPLRVMAGPGSGKTRVIAARAAALLLAGVSPSQILVLTFSRAAAQEMRQRLLDLEGLLTTEQVNPVTVETFHALCFRILRRYRATPAIARDTVRRRWVEQALRENGEELKNDLVEQMQADISGAKNRRLSLEDIPRRDSLFRSVWAAYEEAKAAAGQMDFDDLLLHCCHLLESEPQVLQRLQQRWHFLMVDEFQDTNAVQYQLLRLLAAPQHNLCVVGDVDQAIYSWRDASPELLLNFPQDYPQVTTIELRQNYRSVPPIIHSANRLIAQNQQRHRMTVEPVRRGGRAPKLLTTDSEWSEAKAILTMLRRARERGVQLQEMAVCYRVNSQARPLVSLLVEQDIPFNIRESSQLGLDHWAIQECHAWLRLLVDRDHLESFLTVGRRQLRLNDQTSASLRQICAGQALTPWRAVHQLPTGTVELVKLEQLRKHLDKAGRLPPQQALGYYLHELGYATYLEWYAQQRGFASNAFLGLCEDLKLDLRRFNNLTGYLQHVDKIREALAQPDKPADGLNLMTLHGAKGLEFRVVWIIDAIDGLLPHAQSQTEAQLEEERRLFYVGCTRAKDLLYLFVPHFYRGNETAPSPFLEEALGPSRTETTKQSEPKRRSSEHRRPAPSASTVGEPLTPAEKAMPPRLGMRVTHRTLGVGVITAVSQDTAQRQPFHLTTIDFGARSGVKLHWEYSIRNEVIREVEQ